MSEQIQLSQKVQKFVLRERFASGAGHGPASGAASDRSDRGAEAAR